MDPFTDTPESSASVVTADTSGAAVPDGDDRTWTGQSGSPWIVGNPGRSFGVVPKLSAGVDPPDTVVDGAQAGAMTVRAASVRGLSHRYYTTPRQDAYAAAVTEDQGYVIAIVADGVSSGKYSHQAAKIVTESGAAILADQLKTRRLDAIDWVPLLRELAHKIVTYAQYYADPAGASQPPRPALNPLAAAEFMASTALFAILAVHPNADGDREAAVLAVGDTSAWILRNREWLAIGKIKNEGAQIASSATAALPLVPESPVADHLLIGSDDILVLMTNGVGDPLGNGKGEVGRFLASEWATPPSPLDFAAQVGFARKTFDDDRTVVAIWPNPGT